MIEFDRASLDRVLPAAPGPADWDDVLGRNAARQSRRRRLIVLAIAACTVAVATASAFGLRAYFVDKGFIGLPPEGATPSMPETGELVLSAYGIGSDSRIRLWVYKDGRVISQREFLAGRHEAIHASANSRSSGFLEQRLAVEGVRLLRAEAISTGLFERDLELTVRGGAPCMNFVHVHNGARLVRVTWHGAQCGGGPLGVDPATPAATAKQTTELLGLMERLANPTDWLAAGVWENPEFRAYVPTHFAIEYGVRPQVIDPARVPSLLPRSAEELLRSKERTRRDGFYGSTEFVPVFDYVSNLTTDEARTLAQALDGAADLEQGPSAGSAYVLGYTRDLPGTDAVLFVLFEPILPHGESTCSACG